MVSQGYLCKGFHYSLVQLFSHGSEAQERGLDYDGIYSLKQLQEATGAHVSPVAALKTLVSRGFLTLQLSQRCHGTTSLPLLHPPLATSNPICLLSVPSASSSLPLCTILVYIVQICH